MPELPEVETICRGLDAQLRGKQIRDCVLNRADMRFPFPSNMQEVLVGAQIEAVYRRAKYLMFQLDNGHSILAHLGMSGTMRVVDYNDYQPRKHDHVLWELANDRWFIFHDPRRFGFMLVCETGDLAHHPMISQLGPEPLSEDFTETYLLEALSKRKTDIKVALMDQKLVVGVGNIYASEALFHARISPFMPANEAAKQANNIVQSIQSVLHDAIASGGSTLRDYVRSDGDSGYFQHHFAVYDRAEKPCVSCSQPITMQRQSGRSTYFCHKCQNVKEKNTPSKKVTINA